MLAFLLLKKSSFFQPVFTPFFATFFRSKNNSFFTSLNLRYYHASLTCLPVYNFKIELVIYILFIFLLQHLFSSYCFNRRPGFH